MSDPSAPVPIGPAPSMANMIPPNDPFSRWIYAIATVGFPIIAAGVLGWMLFNTNEQNRQDAREQTVQLRQQVGEIKQALTELRDEVRLLRLAEESSRRNGRN